MTGRIDIPAELAGTPFATPEVVSGVGEGWHPLLVELHRRLVEVDPSYRVAQFKEKFGALRVYVDVSDPERCDAAEAIVEEIERRSATVCERCGNPGALRQGPWVQTLCQEHAAGREPFGAPAATGS